MNTEVISEIVAARIRGGELPSRVLRSVLEESPTLETADLIPILINAFDDSIFLNFICNWEISKESEVRDTQFNIWVLEYLREKGVSLPWDKEYCIAEHLRIEPFLVAEDEAEQKAALEAVSYENLSQKIKELEGHPICIQALWGGDTRGWRVSLEVIMNNDNKLNEEYLGTISYGTDIRLFNGSVPPWPEALYASDVGSRLAADFGVEFYFPSPSEPNDDRMSWIEYKKQKAREDIYKVKPEPHRKKQAWWHIW
jgi:hypothetical protein